MISNAVNSLGIQFVCQQIMLTMFIIIHTIIQPYSLKYSIANKLDTVIFSNLALINALTIYNYFGVFDVHDHTGVVTWIQLVLIYLPLMMMIVKVIMSLKHKWFICQLHPVSRDNMDNDNVYFLVKYALTKESENSALPADEENSSSFMEPSPHHKTF